MTESRYITIPTATLDELAAIGRSMVTLTKRLKTLARQKESASEAPILSDAEFWRERDKLADAFSDLSETELDTLINDAVKWARSNPVS